MIIDLINLLSDKPYTLTELCELSSRYGVMIEVSSDGVEVTPWDEPREDGEGE